MIKHSVTIGKRLKEIRISKGLTLKEAGKIQNVSFQYIQQVEAGKVNIGINTLAGIGKKYDVDLDYLITGKKKRGKKK